MKRLLLLLLSAVSSFAQYAPDSISNKLLAVNITAGTYPFAANGTLSTVYTAAGQWYDLSSTGDAAGNSQGTYSYTKTGPNTATVTRADVGFPNTVATVTFTSPIGGTFTNGLVGLSPQQSGTFAMTPFSATAPLLNIATRTVLSAGQILNPGFVVGGTIPRQVLIRAIGPGLAQFGVPNTMPAPTLKVYSGQTLIANNAGWGGTKTLSDAFTAVGAFGLSPTSKDSAVLLTLNPGNYTAQVVGDVGGDVIVEVYFVN